MTIEDAAREAAGNWQRFTCFVWDRARDLDDPDDWAIIYTHNRDSGLLDLSNADAIAKAMDALHRGRRPRRGVREPFALGGRPRGRVQRPGLPGRRPVPARRAAVQGMEPYLRDATGAEGHDDTSPSRPCGRTSSTATGASRS